MSAEQKSTSAYEVWRAASAYEDQVREAYLNALRVERATPATSPLLPLRIQARHEARAVYDAAMQETDAALGRYQRVQQRREAA